MTQQEIFEDLKAIFNSDEIESIKDTNIKDRNHPVKRLLFPQNGYHEQVIYNTNHALRLLSINGKNQWILGLKHRLLDLDDYSASSSALAEIRAFGSILKAKINIDQISSSGSDFQITDNNNNEKVCLEVHSKQMDKNEAKSLEEFNQGIGGKEYRSPNNAGYVVRTNVTTPFGKPEQGENTTENVISKIASIKIREHQFSNEDTSILWLDFQDETWELFDNIEYLLPYSTWNGACFSGGFWYAFYGWKDAPILEHFYFDNYNQVIKMRHDGRFLQSKKLDAVIISFPRDTVIMENPYSEKPIQSWLWKNLIYLPWFKIQYSYVNWFTNDLKQRIKLDKDRLIEISKISPF